MIAKAANYLTIHLDSLLSIAIRIGGVGLGFLITLFIGRAMGPEALGEYGVITQTGMFLSLVCAGGLDLSVIRSFSEARAKKVLPRTKSFGKLVLVSSLLLLLVSAVVWALEGLIREKLLEGSTTPYAIVFLIAIAVSRSFTRLTSGFLRSQALYVFSNVVEVLIIPIIVVSLILLSVTYTLFAVLLSTALAGLVAAGVGLTTSLVKTSRSVDALDVPMSPLFKRAVPLWGVAVSKNLSDWYSLAVVAALLSLYDAGIFRVAMQVASALPVITIGIFSVFASKFGVAHSKGDFAAIARLARSATVLSCLLVLPVGLFTIIFTDPILTIVGPEFNQGAPILQILLAGQILYVCTGPSGLVLAMTGNERINLLFTIVSLVVLLIALPLAAQNFGLLGLVLVMSTILIVRNIASLVAVRKLTGVNILTGRYHPMQTSEIT
ncbi:lipopolysaccharide biosynthesis protein [Erythrobacter litoralis]|uniref:lipopolysaccharide biosynthesis protein n=1 Tax=Erythrobacter litoralis TaxID=39960 RepID=UPI0024359945|nr:oligosaccharide flippase family protein [Erythrobacter litoralis]